MPISNVALTDTFDTWRTRTNQLAVLINDIDANNVLYFFSNSAPLTLSSTSTRKANVYFKLNVSNSVSDTSTSNLATSNALNIAYTFSVASNAFTISAIAAGNTYASNVGTSGNAYAVSVGTSGNNYAGAMVNTANSFLLSTIINSVTSANNYAGTIANTKLANSSTVYAGTLSFSTAGTLGAPALVSTGSSSTGLYWPSVGTLGLAASGALGVYVATTGNVAIGTTSAPYKLYVQGDIYATGDITAFSDAAIKTDVVTITDALNTVNALRGVRYTRVDNQQKKIGLIAQEVQKVVPELVVNSDNNIGVSYQTVVALLIEAVKELTEKVKVLEGK